LGSFFYALINKVTMNFNDLGLNPELISAVKQLDFISPMPIQEKAIPVLLDGQQDVVALAQTGTGKTAAFGLPLLQRIDSTNTHPQAVILCPTRELCMQIAGDIKQFSRYLKGVHTVAVYGGASIVNQIKQIKRGAQIIAATPGRLIDLLQRKALKLSKVSVTVLDEADEMLNMGFKEDIDRILDTLPPHRLTWLFSATMPTGVAAIAKKYLTDPVNLRVGPKDSSPKNIKHICYTLREKDRYEALKRVIDFEPTIFGLVFCRTRKETQDISALLMQDGYNADALHGDLSQSQREHVMRKFRQSAIRILVATDVAARGLDVDDITHVIHYKLPDEAEVYTHRSGRTARAGKCGTSIALINVREKHRIQAIEKRCQVRFDFGKLPDGPEICKKQLLNQITKIVETPVDHPEIEEYLPAVYDALADMDKEELIKRVVSSEFNRFIEYYRHAADINVKPRTKATKASQASKNKPNSRMQGRKTQRFFINVGRLDNINAGAIVRLICDHCGIRSRMIGQIDLKREFSFFEVAEQAAGKVCQSVKNARLDGRAVQVREVSKSKKKSGHHASHGRTAKKKRGRHRAAISIL
jgi:ATP-dependent RNA helicase DeaD